VWGDVLGLVTNLFEPAAKLIDEVHTSTEEKQLLRNQFQEIKNQVVLKQMDLLNKQLDLQQQLMAAQASIITAEAKSDSFVARNWRPMSMLTFVVLVSAQALGIIEMDPAFADRFMTLVQIGLGGYVVGRSVEKSLPMLKGKI